MTERREVGRLVRVVGDADCDVIEPRRFLDKCGHSFKVEAWEYAVAMRAKWPDAEVRNEPVYD